MPFGVCSQLNVTQHSSERQQPVACGSLCRTALLTMINGGSSIRANKILYPPRSNFNTIYRPANRHRRLAHSPPLRPPCRRAAEHENAVSLASKLEGVGEWQLRTSSRRCARRLRPSHVAMLLLFVTMTLRELQLFSEASPLRTTHGTSRHHHCGDLRDACAQRSALAELRHLSAG